MRMSEMNYLSVFLAVVATPTVARRVVSASAGVPDAELLSLVSLSSQAYEAEQSWTKHAVYWRSCQREVRLTSCL